jgi:hypothetical protein
MSSEKRTAKNKYYLAWNEYGTAEEMLDKVASLVLPAMRNMNEMEGDFYMSDYRDLMSAFWLLKNRKD